MMNNVYLENIEIDGLNENYAQNLDVADVEPAAVTLMDFVIDKSGSMSPFVNSMQECLEHYKNAICNSKQADEMLISKTLFGSDIETGGYIAPKDFNTNYQAYGCTKLYD